VTNGDLVRDAAGELYSSDPDHFVERRGVLVTEARAAGDASAAKSIAGLRKPTRSAWVLNQLVRAEPGAASQLVLLGDELRAAQQSLDGTAIRDLSLRRRQLIGGLARRAFEACGLQSPPAALRDEVTATLGAAMADPQVAEQLRAGTLDRPARRDGFGPGEAPALTLVSPRSQQRGKPAPERPPAAQASHPYRPGPKRAAMRGAKPPAGSQAAPPAKAADLDAARQKSERQRRRQAIAAAELSAAEADRAAAAADRAEQDRERAVQLLEEQLADGRRSLADARLRARRARTGQRRAHQALGRLRDNSPP
jgi:hypothetical protein